MDHIMDHISIMNRKKKPMFLSCRSNLFDLHGNLIEWGSTYDGKAGCKFLN